MGVAPTDMRPTPEGSQIQIGHQPGCICHRGAARNLLKGAGIGDLWWRLLALLGFGLAILTIASLRFRKRVA
jgi:hypothetical protein